MNGLARRILDEDRFNLDQLEKLFSWISATRGWHSGADEIYIDGAARAEIKTKEGELPKHDEAACCGGKVEFKVCLESKP